MASAEEERAVFDDEEEEDDDDSEESDEEFEYEEETTASAAANPNPPSSSDANPNPNSSNPNPNTNPAAAPATAPDPIPQNGTLQTVPVAAAPEISSSADLFSASPDRKRLKISSFDESRRTPAGFDESRRLFQRLWTDEDEIVILRGFLEFTSQRGTTHANYQHDTGPFYEQIKTQLQLDFTKNQLIEKLRRLKKKYRNVVSRMNNSSKDFSFKSAHEKAIYEIACHIWSSTFKRPRSNRDESGNFDGHNGGIDSSDHRVSRSSHRRVRRRYEEAAQLQLPSSAVEIPVMVTQTTQTSKPLSSAPPISVPSVIEETVKCCLAPLFKELLQYAVGGPNGSIGVVGGAMPNPLVGLGLGGGSLMNLSQGSGGGAVVDEKWRKQQILELEVYLKRVELLQDQIKTTLEELRSNQS